MERCRLCGGRLSGGRCKECGLDNRKNDSKYRLNVHNEKGTLLHQGGCEENLNPDRWERKRKKKKPSARPNVARKASEKKLYAPAREGKKDSGKTKNQAAGNTWQTKPPRSAGNTQQAKPSRSAGNTWQAKPPRSAGNTWQTKPSQNAGNTRRTTPADEAKRKQRQNAGTVKKKKRGWGFLLLLILLAVNLIPAAFEFLADNEYEVREFFRTLTDEEESYEVNREDVEAERPKRIAWDKSAEGYWEQEMTPGYYTVGYDIPEGEYQFTCETGTAWIDLLEGENMVDYFCLYAPEEQKWYEENMDEACRYFERSEQVSLKTGTTVYLENCEESIYIEGIGDVSSLKEHEAQGLTETVTMETDPAALEGEPEAEKDFPAGVYDLMLENGAGYASVTVENEKTGKYRYVTLEGEDVFFRFPFGRGDQVKISYQEEGSCVLLVPSY